MRRALPLAIVLGLAAAGCGQDNPELISQDRSQQLLAAVDRIESACSDERPGEVRSALAQAEAQVNELPRQVDESLRDNLRQWLNHIEDRVDRDCEAEPEETPTPTPEATETPVPTATPTPEPTETPEPTAEPTETPAPTAEPAPDDEGGVPAPEEVVPGDG